MRKWTIKTINNIPLELNAKALAMLFYSLEKYCFFIEKVL